VNRRNELQRVLLMLAVGVVGLILNANVSAQVQTVTYTTAGQPTTEVKVDRGTVVLVDGNDLVVKAEDGHLRHFANVPESARATVDGQEEIREILRQCLAVAEHVGELPRDLGGVRLVVLDYPRAKPSNVEGAFYWARVKFGLKPTLRIVQMVTLHGNPNDPVAYAIAQKQLYASHYFETALDLSFCVRGSDDSNHPGFYLIMAMGSEQAGLTGIKGSIVRKTAVGRSVSNLQDALRTIKTTLEGKQ
jgi:hypothetical protein